MSTNNYNDERQWLGERIEAKIKTLLTSTSLKSRKLPPADSERWLDDPGRLDLEWLENINLGLGFLISTRNGRIWNESMEVVYIQIKALSDHMKDLEKIHAEHVTHLRMRIHEVEQSLSGTPDEPNEESRVEQHEISRDADAGIEALFLGLDRVTLRIGKVVRAYSAKLDETEEMKKKLHGVETLLTSKEDESKELKKRLRAAECLLMSLDVERVVEEQQRYIEGVDDYFEYLQGKGHLKTVDIGNHEGKKEDDSDGSDYVDDPLIGGSIASEINEQEKKSDDKDISSNPEVSETEYSYSIVGTNDGTRAAVDENTGDRDGDGHARGQKRKRGNSI